MQRFRKEIWEEFVLLHDYEGAIHDIERMLEWFKPLEESQHKHEKDLQTKVSFTDLKEILEKHKNELKSSASFKAN